jgi:hypothetical protein
MSKKRTRYPEGIAPGLRPGSGLTDKLGQAGLERCGRTNNFQI